MTLYHEDAPTGGEFTVTRTSGGAAKAEITGSGSIEINNPRFSGGPVQVEFRTSEHDDSITFESSPADVAWNIWNPDGEDTVAIGDGLIDPVDGPIDFNGDGTFDLTLDDRDSDSGREFSYAATFGLGFNLRFGHTWLVSEDSYRQFTGFHVFGGRDDDTFSFMEPPDGLDVSLDGGDGQNRYEIGQGLFQPNFSTDLFITGSGDDEIMVSENTLEISDLLVDLTREVTHRFGADVDSDDNVVGRYSVTRHRTDWHRRCRCRHQRRRWRDL